MTLVTLLELIWISFLIITLIFLLRKWIKDMRKGMKTSSDISDKYQAIGFDKLLHQLSDDMVEATFDRETKQAVILRRMKLSDDKIVAIEFRISALEVPLDKGVK